MKKLVGLALLSTMFFACNSANNQQPSTKYEEKKASLGDIEKGSPLKFLKVVGSHHTNIINQAVVSGEITNTATMATYKNITLQISWLDKDGAVIEKEKQVLDDLIAPGATSDFKIKTSHVKGTESVTVDIISAVADK
jgi:hypothetical protein